MRRPVTQDHMTSLRLPAKWDEFIKQFADKWAATPAYVYRSAIRDFIRNQGGKV
jgi:predicted DNA-binding protein